MVPPRPLLQLTEEGHSAPRRPTTQPLLAILPCQELSIPQKLVLFLTLVPITKPVISTVYMASQKSNGKSNLTISATATYVSTAYKTVETKVPIVKTISKPVVYTTYTYETVTDYTEVETASPCPTTYVSSTVRLQRRRRELTRLKRHFRLPQLSRHPLSIYYDHLCIRYQDYQYLHHVLLSHCHCFSYQRLHHQQIWRLLNYQNCPPVRRKLRSANLSLPCDSSVKVRTT